MPRLERTKQYRHWIHRYLAHRQEYRIHPLHRDPLRPRRRRSALPKPGRSWRGWGADPRGDRTDLALLLLKLLPHKRMILHYHFHYYFLGRRTSERREQRLPPPQASRRAKVISRTFPSAGVRRCGTSDAVSCRAPSSSSVSSVKDTPPLRSTSPWPHSRRKGPGPRGPTPSPTPATSGCKGGRPRVLRIP